MGDMSGEDKMALKCTSVELSTGWAFKQTDNSDPTAWLPVKKVPSTVHQDLIDNEKYVPLLSLSCPCEPRAHRNR